jgi:hypothetical protein
VELPLDSRSDVVGQRFRGAGRMPAKITLVNLDGPGEGFNDPAAPDPASAGGGNTGATLGEQRLIAFQRAADIWGRFIDSSITIRVGAQFDPLDCGVAGTTLGQAGPSVFIRNFVGAPRPGTWYPIALANAMFGADLAPATDDIDAQFNSSIGTTCAFPAVWYYGLDADPPDKTIDFVTVVLHELGHGLGFLSTVDLGTGAKFLGFDDAYMLNLEDHTTGLIYPEMTDAERVAASTATGDLHWVGANVAAAGAGLAAGLDPPSGHVEMFAPDPQDPGSSVSHFSTSVEPDESMEPFFIDTNHGPGLARDLMADIGWTTVARDAVSDFGGDGTSDILWRNLSTGNTIAWLMNGFAKGARSIGAPATAWRVEGLGDFDGIGKSDILWRNTETGSTVIWQMNGFSTKAVAGIGAPPLVWQIAGLGDFNGDGMSDILWRNASTGANIIWQMTGLAWDAVGSIPGVPPAWRVAGIGDFDGDGSADILWRNSGAGVGVIWKMSESTWVATASIGLVPLHWLVAGVGDFDGDGTDDILWRNIENGRAVIWRMLGLGQESAVPIGTVSAAWQIERPGDYDGDGKSDILWRNSGTGNTIIWQMNGFATEAAQSIGAPSAVWAVQ